MQKRYKIILGTIFVVLIWLLGVLFGIKTIKKGEIKNYCTITPAKSENYYRITPVKSENKTSAFNRYYSMPTGFSFIYPTSLGEPKVNIMNLDFPWLGTQDWISFPDNHLLITLNSRVIDRGSIVNGISISKSKEEFFISKSGLNFKIITYKIEDTDKYMIEALYENCQDREVVYLNCSDYLDSSQVAEKEKLFKEIIDTVLVK